MNQMNLLGYLGKLNDMRTTQSGKQTFSFTVMDPVGKDKDPNWFKIVVWNDYAVTIEAELKRKMAMKGEDKNILIYAVGRINIDKYKNKEGVEVKSYELNANSVHSYLCLKDSRVSGGNNNVMTPEQQNEAKKNDLKKGIDPEDPWADEEDNPFVK